MGGVDMFRVNGPIGVEGRFGRHEIGVRAHRLCGSDDHRRLTPADAARKLPSEILFG
jgi:hypothetical protein